MPFDFYSDCIFEDDKSIPISDYINIGIAIINLALVVYIFRHQRRREKDEREFQIRSKSSELRFGWFKEVIILPNLKLLNEHFRIIASITLKIKPNSDANKSLIDKKLKSEFSKFSSEFISLLFPIHQNFAQEIQDFSDKCLDRIQNLMYYPDAVGADEDKLKKLLREAITTYKNQVISKIYSFENFC